MLKGRLLSPPKFDGALIKRGIRICIFEKGNEIVLQPLTKDYFEKTAGILKTKRKSTQTLLEERAKEKEKV